MRLGLFQFPLFLYRIQVGALKYAMLARPTSNSMADLFVLREVFIEQTYGQLLPLLRPGGLRVADIGGNLGSFSIWLNKSHGIKEGYCFEPDPTSYNLCRYNLANNGCSSVRHFQKAVGGQSRSIKMFVNTTRPGGNSIYTEQAGKQGETAEVEVIDFSSWVDAVSGSFDVLKLDCEGAEWEILANSKPDTFRRFEIIVAEIHDDPDGKYKVGDFADHLASIGFETLRWDGHSQGLYVGRRLKA